MTSISHTAAEDNRISQNGESGFFVSLRNTIDKHTAIRYNNVMMHRNQHRLCIHLANLFNSSLRKEVDMMKQKRIVSLLTATGVLLANVPLMPAIMPATVLTASADVDEAYLDAFNNGGYGFTRDFDEATGTLTITGEGEMYDEYQLAATPFYDISGLKKLIISDGITNISDFAFSQCKTLTEVTLPESITSIGTCGFGFCSALTDIVLPDSLTIIGQGAFDNCSALKTITIPNGVTSIGENAFNGCTALTSITIPESVTKIGANTFRSCTALTEITVPDSVTEIDASAFEDCDNVTIKCSAGSYAQSYARENNISYEASGADDPVTGTCGDSVTWELNPATGTLTVSGTGAMTDYNWNSPFSDLDFSRLVIADGVTSIGAYAFEDCTALSDVSIADSVTSIGERAFFNCRALSAVSIPESAQPPAAQTPRTQAPARCRAGARRGWR